MFDNVLNNAVIQEIHEDVLMEIGKTNPQLVIDYLIVTRKRQRDISKKITLMNCVSIVMKILTDIQETIDNFEIIMKSDNMIKELKKHVKSEKRKMA